MAVIVRRLPALLVVLSLLLAAASLAIWVRSRSAGDAGEFAPAPVTDGPGRAGGSSSPGPFAGGRLRRIVASTDGRLVFGAYEEPRRQATRPVVTGYVAADWVSARDHPESG